MEVFFQVIEPILVLGLRGRDYPASRLEVKPRFCPGEVRVFPYADVYAGKTKIGTTPFPAKVVLEGTYNLRLVSDKQTKRKKVKIRADRTARVKVSF